MVNCIPFAQAPHARVTSSHIVRLLFVNKVHSLGHVLILVFSTHFIEKLANIHFPLIC